MSDLPLLIADETQLLDTFVALLKIEQDALKLGQTDPLPEISARKTPLIEQLRRLGDARNRRLAQLQLPSDRPGLEQWARTRPTELKQAVQKLLELASEAQRLNDLNGKLIQMRLQHTQAVLDTLAPPQAGAGLYGPRGHTFYKPSGYRLIDTV